MKEPAKFSWWALALILLVSLAHEQAYLTRGINKLDESWQLYTAMRLHAGGTLYDDALWVFPPAHVWTAWLAYWIDPPGVLLSRAIYSSFNVALCAGVYPLALRLMPGTFAVLAGLLVALAAPRGHSYHLLFGYRYLIFGVLALLALDRRFRGGGPGWMFVAGALIGIAVTFRLTPAFSVSCGVAVALVAHHHPRWRDWVGDGLRYAAGVLVAMAPTLLYFSQTVGLARLWQEVVVHPLAMLQPLPLPTPEIPEVWDRYQLTIWFVAIQFRAIWVFYFAYVAGLFAKWVQCQRRGEPFPYGLLTALVVAGLVFFIRSTGRSDEPHLDSVIPPVCILVAHFLSLAFGRIWPAERGGRGRTAAAVALCAGVLASWVFLLGVDEVFLEKKPHRPIESLRGRIATPDLQEAWAIDQVVEFVDRHAGPDDTILNLAPSPLFHFLTGRTGPGYFDIMMPGTFLSDEDEIWFLEHLKRQPPAVVIWPVLEFDGMPERNISVVAPRITAWVRANYKVAPGKHRRYTVYIPKDA